MKIKIIDLLNKIANGEEVPKKIKCGKDIFAYNKDRKDYIHQIDEKGWYSETLLFKIKDIHFIKEFLETEVEIIEEDKPIEELEIIENEIDKQVSLKVGEHLNTMRKMDVVFAQKINELVKEIKKMKEDK